MSTILSDKDNQSQIPCYDSLGMQNGQIPNASITASSNFGSAHRARLYSVAEGGKPGAWVAALSDSCQWLQVKTLYNCNISIHDPQIVSKINHRQVSVRVP